jgi:hypothetical protein
MRARGGVPVRLVHMVRTESQCFLYGLRMVRGPKPNAKVDAVPAIGVVPRPLHRNSWNGGP